MSSGRAAALLVEGNFVRVRAVGVGLVVGRVCAVSSDRVGVRGEGGRIVSVPLDAIQRVEALRGPR